MRVVLESSALAAALRLSVAKPNPNLAVLGHVLLKASGERVSIESTDTELSANLMVDADVIEAGELLFDAALLASAAACDADLTITPTHVQRGRSRLKVPTLSNVDDFPAVNHRGFQPIALPAAELAAAIDVCSYATGDDVRVWMRGIHLTNNTASATDGYRMVVMAVKHDGPGFIVPRTNLAALRKLLDGDAKLSLSFNSSGDPAQLRVRRGDDWIATRLIGERAMTFDDQIRQPPLCDMVQCVAKTTELREALRAFLPFGTWTGVDKGGRKGTYSSARVVLDKDAGCRLEHLTNDSVEDFTAAMTLVSGRAEFGMNLRHLAETLEQIETDTVELRAMPAGAREKFGRVWVHSPGVALPEGPMHLLTMVTV